MLDGVWRMPAPHVRAGRGTDSGQRLDDCSGAEQRSKQHAQDGGRNVSYAINHIHLKAHDPAKSAAWWVEAFNFRIISDTVREGPGDRFVTCESENGIRVNISGARTGETLGPGDAGVHEGLEHFGLDSSDLETDIARLEQLGATLLDGPIEGPAARICFMRAPDDVRIELIQRLQG